MSTTNGTAAFTWPSWCSGTTSDTGITATATWAPWNAVYYSSAGTSAVGTVWGNWNITWAATPCTVAVTTNGAAPMPIESDEQRAARLERERVQREQWVLQQRRRAKERKAAESRAKKLLLMHLDPEQRKSYAEEQRFTVISADGQRTYRIKRSRSWNTELVGPDGRVIRRYCAHPIEQVPDEDAMLANKFMIETCEDEFLRLANVKAA